MLQQKIGKFGLNLSHASTAVYFSNGFSREDRIQTEDRIEHTHKKEPLLLIDLVCRNSIDQTIVKTLTRKESVSQYYLAEKIVEDMKRRRR